MKNTSAFFLILIVKCILVCMKSINKLQLPHVLTVVVDDAGVADTGFSSKLFNDKDASPILTPFIDSLADEGIKLTNYYTHPTCTPSRIALMTGTYAYMHGIPFAITGNSGANPPIGVDPEKTTLGQMFQSVGYKTHLVGKWHLGHSREVMQPPRRGFNSFYGLMGGAFDHYKKTSGKCVDLWHYDDNEMMQSKKMVRVPVNEINVNEHATKLFSNKAIDIINSHPKDKNLFIYLAYTAPHDPLQADLEYIQKCSHISNENRKIFCGMMLQLDYELSRVVQSLKDNDLWENTILNFTTDNGGMPIVGGYNYPFRGMKSDSWEGGVRGPAFIRIPQNYYKSMPDARKFKGSCFEGLFHISDWLPTLKGLLSYQGAKFDETLFSKITGVDQSYALINKKAEKFLTDKVKCNDSFKLMKNQTEFFNSRDFPRKSLIPQADMFMNAISMRQGCYKIIIGRPGGKNVYREGKTIFTVAGEENKKEQVYITALNNLLVEYGLSNTVKLIDFLTEKKVLPVNTDMFYKVGAQNLIDLLIDRIQKRKYYALTSSSKYIKYINETNTQLLKEGKLNQSSSKEGILDFVFNNGTTNKYQNNPPQLKESEYNTVLFYNVCEDPSEINDLSKMTDKALLVNEMYEILLSETQKAPPQFAGDAASKLSGQIITVLRDDGSSLKIQIPSKTREEENECDLSHMPFIPDDLSITELARIYDQGQFYRTLPDKIDQIKKKIPFFEILTNLEDLL